MKLILLHFAATVDSPKQKIPAKFKKINCHHQYHTSAIDLSRYTYVPLFLRKGNVYHPARILDGAPLINIFCRKTVMPEISISPQSPAPFH